MSMIWRPCSSNQPTPHVSHNPCTISQTLCWAHPTRGVTSIIHYRLCAWISVLLTWSSCHCQSPGLVLSFLDYGRNERWLWRSRFPEGTQEARSPAWWEMELWLGRNCGTYETPVWIEICLSRAFHPEPKSLECKQAQPAEPTTPGKHMRADRENLTAWHQTMIARSMHPTRGVMLDKGALPKAENTLMDELTFHLHEPTTIRCFAEWWIFIDLFMDWLSVECG